MGHQVKALLLGHTGDHGEKGHVGPDLQTHALLELGLAGGLAVQVSPVVPSGEQRVGAGVEYIPVDAVDDTGELSASCVEDALQPLGIIGGLDLVCVAGADGVDPVGKHTAGLQEVRAAVELHELPGVVAGIHAQQVLHIVKAELALEGDVVDGQQETEIFLHTAGVLSLGQHGDHGGVPVVAVYYLGPEVQQRQRIQHGAAEVGVLLPLGIAAAVDLVPEILLIIHQVDHNTVQHQLFNAHIGLAPAQIAVEMEHMLSLPGIFVFDDPVIRDDDSGVNAQSGQRLGESPHHIGKTAGLGQRGALRRTQQHCGQLASSLFLQHITKFLFHPSLPPFSLSPSFCPFYIQSTP